MDSDVFHVNLSRHPGRVTVAVRGELDLQTTPGLRVVLLEACQPPSVDVFVDLTAVGFFDALTLGLLATTARQLGATSHRIVVHGLSAWQERVVRLCSLEKLLGAGGPAAGEPSPCCYDGTG